MSPKIAPTRGNMVKFASSLKLAEKGHDLLEQKRTILLMELMGKIREAKELQRSLEEVFSKAYFSLQMAGLSLGIENVEELSYSVPETDGFTVRLHSVMGVEIPKVDPVNRPPEPCYSFLGTSGTLDGAYLHATEVLSLIARLAEVETSVYRLAVQIRRTFRRVNALEKVVIPSRRRMLAWIANVLEENDREDFTRMKMAREGMENEGGGIL
ncbi:MAG: V-type ATP synthase subunit D [Aminivibrio sp.]|mgnify:FL=1|jgi:V/A-type H+-transporting ATPase subunit D|nr:V-type ATP synthase subunit D [Aminivibrio sp.]